MPLAPLLMRATQVRQLEQTEPLRMIPTISRRPKMPMQPLIPTIQTQMMRPQQTKLARSLQPTVRVHHKRHRHPYQAVLTPIKNWQRFRATPSNLCHNKSRATPKPPVVCLRLLQHPDRNRPHRLLCLDRCQQDPHPHLPSQAPWPHAAVLG